MKKITFLALACAMFMDLLLLVHRRLLMLKILLKATFSTVSRTIGSLKLKAVQVS